MTSGDMVTFRRSNEYQYRLHRNKHREDEFHIAISDGETMVEMTQKTADRGLIFALFGGRCFKGTAEPRIDRWEADRYDNRFLIETDNRPD